MPRDYSYEEIEQYLAGAFPETERVLLEEQLRTDTALQQRLEICRTAPALILQHKLTDLKSIMAAEQIKADKTSSFPFNKTGMAVLAGAVLLSGVVLYNIKEDTHTASIIQTPSVQTGHTASSSASTHRSAEKNAATYSPVTGSSNKEHTTVAKDSVPENIHHGSVNSVTDIHQTTRQTDPQVHHPESDHTNTQANTHTETRVNLCADVHISADISSTDPCTGTQEGQIELKNLRGGKAPYKISINDNEAAMVYVFNQLDAGTYRMEVTDANGCKHAFNPLLLTGKNCSRNYDFNAGQGQSWEGPVVEQPATLRIIDKAGTLVYAKQMSSGEQCTWTGHNQAGAAVHGYFVFTLEYKDGSLSKGSITVIE